MTSDQEKELTERHRDLLHSVPINCISLEKFVCMGQLSEQTLLDVDDVIGQQQVVQLRHERHDLASSGVAPVDLYILP